MCILIRTRKGVEDPEKAGIFLLFFSFPCKKICASLYTSTHAEYMCIHGEWKKEAEMAKKSVSILLNVICLLDFLFPWKKNMCILIRTPNGAEDPGMCAYMANGKRGEEGAKRQMFFTHTKRGRRPWEKGKELRRYPLFALLFVFLCFAFLCSFCFSFGLKKRKERGEKRWAATTTALQEQMRTMEKRKFKKRMEKRERFFMEKKEN